MTTTMPAARKPATSARKPAPRKPAAKAPAKPAPKTTPRTRTRTPTKAQVADMVETAIKVPNRHEQMVVEVVTIDGQVKVIRDAIDHSTENGVLVVAIQPTEQPAQAGTPTTEAMTRVVEHAIFPLSRVLHVRARKTTTIVTKRNGRSTGEKF